MPGNPNEQYFELFSEKIMAGFAYRYSQDEANRQFLKLILEKASIRDSQISSRMAAIGDLLLIDLYSITKKQFQIFSDFLKNMKCDIYEDTVNTKSKRRAACKSLGITINSAECLIDLVFHRRSEQVSLTKAGLFKVPTVIKENEAMGTAASFWMCNLV